MSKPMYLDKCIVDVNGFPATPSRSVLDGLYPPAEFEQVETYTCHTLYLWQIDDARQLKAEVIGYIGQGVWVALKRRMAVNAIMRDLQTTNKGVQDGF